MPLSEPQGMRSPERLLLFGPPGGGKTSAALSIALMALQTRSPRRFHFIDIDDSFERMTFMSRYSPLSVTNPGTNVTLYRPKTWPEMAEASAEAAGKAGEGDFIIVDRGDVPWDTVKTFYIASVYGSVQDYLMAARMEIKAAADQDRGSTKQFGGLEPDDWEWIKRFYFDFEYPLTINSQAHSIFTSSGREINKSRDGSEIQRDYGRIGYKPGGQKHLHHRLHTAIFMASTKTGWEATKGKDRERDGQWTAHGGLGQTIEIGPSGFVMEYLVKIAGWSLA